MTERSLTDRAVDGVAWQAALHGGNLVLKAVILIFLARNIPAAEFGLIAAATVVTSLATDFSQLGVHRALVQRLELREAHITSAFAISLLTGVAAAVLIYLAAPLFVGLFRMSEVEPLIEFLSVTLLFTGLAAVSKALLQREHRFRTLGVIELGSYIAGFGLVALPLALIGYGAWALAIGLAVQVLVRMVWSMIVRPPGFAVLPERQASRELLHTGYGFSMGQVANFAATQVDYLVVGRWLGAEQLGYYSKAYQFLVLPAQMFGTVTSTVLFPTIATIQDQPERAGRAYLRSLGVIAMLTLPVSGILAIIAPELILLVLGPQWAGMVVPFQILVLTLIFRTSYKISDAVTLAMGSMYQRASRQAVYAVLVGLGAYVGAFFGLWAVAIGVGLAVTSNHVMMVGLARRLTGVSRRAVIAVQARQLAGAAALVAPVWAIMTLGRMAEWGKVETLGLASLAGIVTLAVLWFALRPIYGPEGAWLNDLASKRWAAMRQKLGKRAGH